MSLGRPVKGVTLEVPLHILLEDQRPRRCVLQVLQRRLQLCAAVLVLGQADHLLHGGVNVEYGTVGLLKGGGEGALLVELGAAKVVVGDVLGQVEGVVEGPLYPRSWPDRNHEETL